MRSHRRQKGGKAMSATGSEYGGAVIPESKVGAELRAARQRLGWSLTDVAQSLRIRQPYLQAIEEGRLSDLPGNAYAVGFIRTYASTLGLDATEVARRFRAEAQEVNRKTELAFPAPVPDRGVPAGAVVLVGLVIAAGAYAGWYKLSGDTRGPTAVPAVPERLAPLADRAAPPSNPSPQVASILPSPATPPPAARPPPTAAANGPAAAPPPAPVPALPPAPPPPAPVAVAPPPPPPVPEGPRVVLRFKADSYVQVKERQGAVLLNRVMRAGETWPVPRGTPLLLTTGNAGGTELVVEGVASPALGAAGAVRRDLPLDADTIRPGATLGPVPRPAAP